MIKYVVLVVVLSCGLFFLSLYNNYLFNSDKRYNDSVKSHQDSLLFRLSDVQDSLLQQTILLDSIYFNDKVNDSIIKNELQQVRNDYKRMLKVQRQIVLNQKQILLKKTDSCSIL